MSSGGGGNSAIWHLRWLGLAPHFRRVCWTQGIAPPPHARESTPAAADGLIARGALGSATPVPAAKWTHPGHLGRLVTVDGADTVQDDSAVQAGCVRSGLLGVFVPFRPCTCVTVQPSRASSPPCSRRSRPGRSRPDPWHVPAAGSGAAYGLGQVAISGNRAAGREPPEDRAALEAFWRAGSVGISPDGHAYPAGTPVRPGTARSLGQTDTSTVGAVPAAAEERRSARAS
jgi:hypothetical protein